MTGFLVDAAYMFLAQDDRRGRVVDPPSGQAATLDLNSGVYSFDGHLFGLTLRYVR